MAGLIVAIGIAAAFLLAAATLRFASRWAGVGDRRLLVLLAMLGPALILGVLLGGSLSMVMAGCPLFTPVDHVILTVIAGCFLSFLTVACMRQAAKGRRARRDLLAVSEPVTAGPLHDVLARLAVSLGLSPPELRVAGTPEPLACSLGIRHPVIVLSSGLLARLDAQETEAVLAHELAHLKQHDHLVGFLIAWLRDSLFYVPAAAEGWEHYSHHREIACDALSASATGRPGALASALVKVGAGGPPPAPGGHAASFGPDATRLEARLAHLLGDVPPARAGRAVVTYGILVAGVMGTIVVLSPIWYMPFCMNLICRLPG